MGLEQSVSPSKKPARGPLKVTLSILKWLFITIVVLLTMVTIALMLPPVQKFVIQKGTSWFNEKTGGNLAIEDIDLRLPWFVNLNGVSLDDPSGNNVATIGSLKTSIGWRMIFNNTIRIDRLELEGVNAEVYSDENGRWNYDFIIEAFADSTAVPDTSTAPSAWDFSLGNLKIRDANLQYFDATSRDSIATSLGSLDVVMDRFSITEMVFLAESVRFTDSKTYMQMSVADTLVNDSDDMVAVKDTSSTFPDLFLKELYFENHELTYLTLDDAMRLDLKLGVLEMEADEIDLSENRFALDRLKLHNSDFTMRSVSTERPDTTVMDYNDLFLPFHIEIAEISLAENNVSLTTVDLENTETLTEIGQINFEVEDLEITPDLYALKVESMSADYAGVPAVSSLSFELRFEPTAFSLSDFQLALGQSNLSANIEAEYKSLKALIEEAIFTTASLNINPLSLHPDDARQIVVLAGLNPDSIPLPDQVLHLEASLSGNQQAIDLNQLDLKMGSTFVNLKGTSKGSQLERHTVNLTTLDLGIFLGDIVQFLPENTDLSTFPQEVYFSGRAKASPNASSLKGQFNMDLGKLDIDATSGGWASDSFPLEAHLSSDMLDLSSLVGIDSLQLSFDLKADISNAGSDHRIGNVVLLIPEIDYGPYVLENFISEVEIDGDAYSYHVEVADTHAVVIFDGTARLGDTLELNAEGDVRGIDFEYLGLTENDLRVRTHFIVNYNQHDSIQTGSLQIDESVVIKEGERIDVHPITAQFHLCPDSVSVEIISQIFSFKTASNLSVDVLQDHLAGLFKDNPDSTINQEGYWTLDFQSSKNEILQEFLPALTKFAPSTARIDYDALSRQIEVDVDFPEIVYDKIFVDSLTMNFVGKAGSIAGNLHINRAAYDTLSVENITLSLEPAEVGNYFSFSILNRMDTAQYLFEASLIHNTSDTLSGWIIEPSDTFVMDGKVWDVDPAARITLKDSLYGIENFLLRRDQNELSIHTPIDDNVLHISAKNFSLAYISGLLSTEENLIEGRLSAEMNINADGTFAGNGKISDLILAGAEFGALNWDASSEGKSYFLTAGLDGPVANLKADGVMTSLPSGDAELDIEVNLSNFMFESLVDILPSLIENAEGELTADISVNGTTAAPQVSGALNFDNIYVRMVDNRADYYLRNEKIKIEKDAFIFPSFSIADSSGQKMVIDGRVNHTNFTDLIYDLHITSDNFTLLNLLPGDDPLVYGKLIVASDIELTGSQIMPKVRSDISLKEGSSMVFQVPDKQYDDASFDGLVEWASFDEEEKIGSGIIGRDKTEETEKVQSTSVDLSGTLNIDPQTRLKIVIDPIAGDNLTIQGGGKLGIGYDRSGNISLSGTYSITSGEYLLTFYDVVKRSFQMNPGSTITWSGDLYTPEMNITAIYKTRIALGSLMGTAGGDQSSFNESLRRQADFELHMTLEGDLENPEISFEIKMGPDSRGVLGGAADARLAQINSNEGELNRQVFAMLVLNSFISESGGDGGSAVENSARNSASQILTQQLNNLSDKMIGGVELTFDLQSYTGQTGAGETDLSVDLAKSLFDDRVVVKVGSTMALEGDNAGASESQQLVTNVVVEYLITPDGRYRFKVFRSTDLEDIVVGRVTRTGAGVMFRREFDRGKQVFNVSEEEKAAQEEAERIKEEKKASEEREKEEGKQDRKQSEKEKETGVSSLPTTPTIKEEDQE